jgi:hypothetical protein
MKELKIKWIARDKYFYDVAPKPYPASQSIPDWWKHQTPYLKSKENPDGKKLIVENLVSNATFKKCTPMLDALGSGYIVPLWSDVQVRKIDGSSRITWKVKTSVFEQHGPSSYDVPTPPGYGEVFKYSMPWIPVTPPGYSIIVSSPYGYQDIPFKAIPAIVDSDKSKIHLVPPMWLRLDYEGILEKGTPLVQITPFKRESWKQEFDFYQDGEIEKIEDKYFHSTIVNNYIKNHWSKKKYS